MPLARIFTRNPERTADLSSQLKQQGYSVEVTRPDQANLEPADLEIEFEICERADVLDRAADLAGELGADVVVAPGILQMAAIEPVIAQPTITQPIAAKPIATHPVVSEPMRPEPVVSEQIISEPVLSEQIASAKIQRAPVGVESMPEDMPGLESHPAAEHDPERDFEAAFAPVIEMEIPAAVQANQEVVNAPVIAHVPMPPVAFMEETPIPKPIAAVPLAESYPAARVGDGFPPASAVFSETSHSADPMPYLAQLTPFTIPASRTSESSTEQLRSLPLVRPQEPPQILRGSKVLQDGARIAAHTWAGALALAASTTASVRDHFEEYKKRAQVRSAEARAAHAARLLDLEQRRAEAHQRAADLERAREQAAARLMELVRQREPGLPAERLRESMAFEPSAPVQSKPSQSYYERPPVQERRREVSPVAPSRPEAAAKLKRASITATPVELWRSINPPLRSVLTGAAAVSALFIMGIALGLFHSRPQMASTPNNTASSGVTVQTGGVTVAAAKPQGAQAVAGHPNAGTPRPVQPATTAQTAKPSPRLRQTRLVAEQSEKHFGDDVVIRHYSRPVPTQKPKQAGQQAGLKHFSDLEN